MKRTTALGTACIGTLAGLLASLAVPACRGEDVEFDCSSQQQAFTDAFADDGELLTDITESDSYPMAMVLSEAGIQKLLNGLVGSNVPFASKLQIGPYGLNFFPQTTPVIEIVKVPGCSSCVLFSLDFNFQLEAEDGDPAGAGIGSAVLAIPLALRQNDDGSSSLVASYDRATVKQMPISTMGFDSADQPGLQGALAILATRALQAQYPTTELLHFAPWTIGGNDVKLAARRFAIFTESKVISLGLQTNLDLPRGVAVKVGESLPKGVPMQVQMHPGLLLAMSQRMITEGVISRTYNDQGQPDPKGLYGVTLESLQANTLPGSNLLDVNFRVWRTQDGYCGYADAVTSLDLSINQSNDSIQVTPTDELRVTGGEGIGALAEDNEELIAKNKKLVDVFKKDLSEQVGITINYNEVGVEGSTILFDTQALVVEQDNIDIIIDFKVVASEDI